ncbi:MAG: alpha/beta hydrolase [Caldilineaceae bacterium]|nr:alpha/beta hydrolase [Caldilineaceae bacterium]
MLRHETVKTNGVRLHVVQAGPEDGPLVILLHGFPEFWYGWRRQIPALAEAGYWVWAPDQRGYNLSDKPAEIPAYNLDELTRDIVGLIDAAGREKAFVIGHDWGAAVAWWLAIHYPERVEKLGILNVPHPSVMAKTLRSQPRQLLKSWYIFFFQIPRLPEFLISRGQWQGAKQIMRRSSRPGSFSDEDLEMYREAWSQPQAFTSMINWYRAAVRNSQKMGRSRRVSIPTLMLWGVNDVALDRSMAQPSIDFCDEGRLVFFEQATHWVQHDEADKVTKFLLDFLAKSQ